MAMPVPVPVPQRSMSERASSASSSLCEIKSAASRQALASVEVGCVREERGGTSLYIEERPYIHIGDNVLEIDILVLHLILVNKVQRYHHACLRQRK
jgi:hypothetical protein